jgi:DNA-binding transcriptional LysR family regulator
MQTDNRLLNGASVFLAVVESGSFARAAVVLDMTSSGVSRAVARLEQRVGVRLLHRTTRAVRATAEGERFYEEVAPLLAGIQAAAEHAGGASGQVRGHLRVRADGLFSRVVLAPRIGELLALYPELDIELQTHEDVGDLVADGIDVAVRFGEPASSNLVSRRLLSTRVLTVASPAYLERHGRPKRPQDLPQHRCIGYRDAASGRPYPWEFHRKGKVLPVTVPFSLLFTDVGAKLEACLAGAGITQVLALGMQPLMAQGRLVELFPDWPGEVFPLHAFYPSRRHPPAKVRAFIDFCLALVGQGDTIDTARQFPGSE